MAGFLRRWRGPLLSGVAVWLLSFPLVMSHPVQPTHPVYARTASLKDTEASDHLLVRRLMREQQAALEAQAASAAAAVAGAQVTQAPAPAAGQPSQPALAARPATVTVRANTIVIPRLGLVQPVGWYGDCLGRAAVPRWGAWRWSCAGSNNTYIMAHNPGVFTPILGLRAGDIVKYGDPSGRVHTYRVSYTTIVANTQMWPLGATAGPSLTLQTCWTWDGSRDFIVRALEI
jgi:sortase (surface protein transpeptidase)